MKRLFLFLLICSPFLSAAQTNFDEWSDFKAKNGISLKHPENWQVSETEPGKYVFRNPFERLGTFEMTVETFIDSVGATDQLQNLMDENDGSKLSNEGDRSMLMYKTNTIRDGEDMEVHHWVIQRGKMLIHCTYTFRISQRDSPNINEELKQAYGLIESMNFS